MADIFVSDKREDRETVRPLVGALAQQGWSVWWDPEIGTGEIWDRKIEQELAAARCIVVVWSPRSVQSEPVRLEAHHGRGRGILIPVTIEGAKPPLSFSLTQTADLSNWGPQDATDPNLLSVIEGVRRVLSTAPPKPEASKPRTPQPPGEDELWAAARDSDKLPPLWSYLSTFPNGRHAEAARQRLRTLDRHTFDHYLQAARKYAGEGEFGRAVTAFTAAIAHEPRSVEALAGRAESLHKTHKFDLAIADCDRALALQPRSAKLLATRARANLVSGNKAQAVIDSTAALQIEPDNSDALLTRGHAHREARKLDAAIADYDAVVRIDPDYPLTYYVRGLVHSDKRDPARAINDFSKCIGLHPEFAPPYAARGQEYEKTNQRDKAMADYDKSIAFDPDFAPPYFYRGLGREKLKDYGGARKDYEKAIELSPDGHSGPHSRLGFFAMVSMQLDEAIAHYTKAIEFDPNHAQSYECRGSSYGLRKQAGDRERMISDYRRALALEPHNSFVRKELDRLGV